MTVAIPMSAQIGAIAQDLCSGGASVDGVATGLASRGQGGGQSSWLARQAELEGQAGRQAGRLAGNAGWRLATLAGLPRLGW